MKEARAFSQDQNCHPFLHFHARTLIKESLHPGQGLLEYTRGSYNFLTFDRIGLHHLHGWRSDPILLFSQVLIIASLLVAGWENIRLRGLLANMAKVKKKKGKT